METTLLVLSAAIAMIGVESLAPGRRWPRVKGWIPRALLLNAAQAGAVYVAGVTWVRKWGRTRISGNSAVMW